MVMKHLTHSLKFLFAMVAVASLSACANMITSEVTRIHNLPRPVGDTIEVVAKDDAKNENLEFRKYARLVGEQLGQFGYRSPVEGEPSKLIARFDYSVDVGQIAYSGYSPDNYFDDNTHDGYSSYERSHHIYGQLYSSEPAFKPLRLDVVLL